MVYFRFCAAVFDAAGFLAGAAFRAGRGGDARFVGALVGLAFADLPAGAVLATAGRDGAALGVAAGRGAPGARCTSVNRTWSPMLS